MDSGSDDAARRKGLRGRQRFAGPGQLGFGRKRGIDVCRGAVSGNGEYPSSDKELKAVRFNTQRSSLAAVGWGLAYPDLARTAPLIGGLVPEKHRPRVVA